MDKYICTVCDWVYDPEIGDPEHGIAPGTKFEDIPDESGSVDPADRRKCD